MFQGIHRNTDFSEVSRMRKAGSILTPSQKNKNKNRQIQVLSSKEVSYRIILLEVSIIAFVEGIVSETEKGTDKITALIRNPVYL